VKPLNTEPSRKKRKVAEGRYKKSQSASARAMEVLAT